MYWLAAAIVILAFLCWYYCREEFETSPPIMHVIASASSRPLPALTYKESRIARKILEPRLVFQKGVPVGPRGVLELNSALSTYIGARNSVSQQKSLLLALEEELTRLKIASQNNYNQDIKEKTRTIKDKWQERQKILSLSIGKYNSAAGELRNLQRRERLWVVQF